MASFRPRALIVTGYGENCNSELRFAYEQAGALPAVVHINSILSGKFRLKDYHILNWGGGFLDGDDLGSARAAVSRLGFRKISKNQTFIEELKSFIDDGKIVAGQCNGFQLLVKTGILPGIRPGIQEASLTYNQSGKFEDRWVNLTVPTRSKCIWTRGLKMMRLPVRHGEGRLIFPLSADGTRTRDIIRKEALTAMQYSDEFGNPTDIYPDNPNGSTDAIAGLSDRTGRVFGLMPHPEAFILNENDPFWTRQKAAGSRTSPRTGQFGKGFQIFSNAVNYIMEEWR